jgi:uncharacterized protein YecT (DUF1311 family)
VLFSRSLLIAALVATAASAQTQSQIEKRYSPEYAECMDASDNVNAVMKGCVSTELKIQTARINQAYAMVMRPLAKPRKNTLRALQRSWIKQRDAKCARASDAEGGGTMAGLIYAGCILDETIKRTIFLENYKG